MARGYRPEKQNSGSKCTRCGRGKHSRQECPAREAICHSCKRGGHFQSQCYSRQQQSKSAAVGAINKSSDEEDSIYLNTISTVDSVVGSMWSEKITVNDTEAAGIHDTGAEVTVITEDLLASLSCKDKLQKPDRVLCGPDGRVLPVIGQVAVKLSLKEHTTVQIAYVLKNLSQSLLGLPAISGSCGSFLM